MNLFLIIYCFLFLYNAEKGSKLGKYTLKRKIQMLYSCVLVVLVFDVVRYKLSMKKVVR